MADGGHALMILSTWRSSPRSTSKHGHVRRWTGRRGNLVTIHADDVREDFGRRREILSESVRRALVRVAPEKNKPGIPVVYQIKHGLAS